MAAMDTSTQALIEALNNLSGKINDASASFDPLKEANQSSVDSIQKSKEIWVTSIKDFSGNLVDLSKTLLEQKRSFSAYGGVVDSVTKSMSNLLGSFGNWGKVLGGSIQTIGSVTKLYFDQADSLNKATDELKKIGTAGSFTGKTFLDLAHNAGIASKNLGLITGPIKDLGQSLIVLGGNTGDATKNFAEIIKYSDKQLAMADRLGISQEELIKTTADYIDLQIKSGKATKEELKDKDKVRQLSFEYAESLAVMSKITGMEAKEMKQRQKDAAQQLGWQLYQRELRQKGRTGEAEASQGMINALAPQLSPRLLGDIQKFMTTGVVTGQLANLNMTGDLMKMRSGISGATTQKEGQEIAAKFATALSSQMGRISTTSRQALTLSSRYAGATGFSDLENRNFMLREEGRGASQTEELIKARQDILKAEKEGYDKAADARANLTEIERKAAVKLDELVEAGNPLIDGFNGMTAVVLGLTGVVGAASVALANLAKNAGAAAIGGIPGGVPSTGGSGGGGTMGRAGSVLGKAAKFAGKVLPGVATIASGYQAYSRFQSGDYLGAGIGAAGAVAGLVPGVGTAIAIGATAINEGRDYFKDKDKATEGGHAETNIDEYLNFTGQSGSKSRFNELDPSLRDRIVAAAQDYKKATGKKLTINSAKRDPDDQRRLYEETVRAGRPGIGPTGDKVAKPGASKHERGLAVDIQQYGDVDAVLALNKQGLMQTVPNDKVHFELIGGGSKMQARSGGMFSGPESGYPVTLHGNEAVVPLEPNSIITKLMKASEAETKSSTLSNSIDNQAIYDLMNILTNKLDDVVNTLQASKNVQDKLLQYTRA